MLIEEKLWQVISSRELIGVRDNCLRMSLALAEKGEHGLAVTWKSKAMRVQSEIEARMEKVDGYDVGQVYTSLMS